MGEMGTPYATDFFGSCVDKHGFDSVSDIMVLINVVKPSISIITMNLINMKINDFDLFI